MTIPYQVQAGFRRGCARPADDSHESASSHACDNTHAEPAPQRVATRLFLDHHHPQLTMDKALPTDVLDYILASVSDLRSLSSAVQVSKRLNTVYKTRERSLRAAVARNEVGPALPAALRLARYDTDARFAWQDFNWQGFTEDSEYDIDWTLAKELRANAAAMCELENLYSQMYELIDNLLGCDTHLHAGSRTVDTGLLSLPYQSLANFLAHCIGWRFTSSVGLMNGIAISTNASGTRMKWKMMSLTRSVNGKKWRHLCAKTK